MLLQGIESSSLCFIVNPCLTILYVICVSVNFILVIYLSLSLFPFNNHSLFSMSVSLFVLCKQDDLYYILDSTYKRYHRIFVFCLTYFTYYDNF